MYENESNEQVRVYDTSSPDQINPWTSIVYRPRVTIRYVLDTGAWTNIWLLYAIVFIGMLPGISLNFFAQPNTSGIDGPMGELTTNVMSALMLGVYVFVGYPLGMLMLYITGWLYRVVGSWLGGTGTNPELRVTLAWTYVVSMYTNWVMLPIWAGLVFYYQTTRSVEPGMQLALSLLQLGISLPVFIYYAVIASMGIGEAHRFSAWKGLGTLIIAFFIMMAVMTVLFVIPVMILVFVLLAAA